MKTLFFTMLFIVVFCTHSVAQNNTIETIRTTYADVQRRINEEDFVYNTIEVNNSRMVRAIGLQNIKTKLYYDEDEKHIENSADVDFIYTFTLRKVEIYYNVIVTNMYKEYVFDKKGNLLFHFIKTEGIQCGERRYYFDGDKLIRIHSKGIDNKPCDAASKYYETYIKENDFTETEQKESKHIRQTAKQFETMLQSIQTVYQNSNN